MLYNLFLITNKGDLIMKSGDISTSVFSALVLIVSTAANVTGAWIMGTHIIQGSSETGAFFAAIALLAEAGTLIAWKNKWNILLKIMLSLVCIMFMSVKAMSMLSHGTVSEQTERHEQATVKQLSSVNLLDDATKYLTLLKQAKTDADIKSAAIALSDAKSIRAGKSTVWSVTSRCTKGGHPNDCATIKQAEHKYNSLAVVSELNDAEIKRLNGDMQKLISGSPALSRFVISGNCSHSSQILQQGGDKPVTNCLLFEQKINLSAVVNNYVDNGVLDVHTPSNYQPSWVGAGAAKVPEGSEYITYLLSLASGNSLNLIILLVVMSFLEVIKNASFASTFNSRDSKSDKEISGGNSTEFFNQPIVSNFVSARGVVSHMKSDFNINDLADGHNRENLTKSFLTKQRETPSLFGNAKLIAGVLSGMVVDAIIRKRESAHADSLAEKTRAEVESLAEVRGIEKALAANDSMIVRAMKVIESPESEASKKVLAEKVIEKVMERNEKSVMLAAVDMSMFFRRCTMEMGMQVIRSGEGMAAFRAYRDDRRELIAKVYRDFFIQFRAGGVISVDDFAGIVSRNKERMAGGKASAGHSLARNTIVPTLTNLGFIIRQGQGKPMKMCSDEMSREIWRDKIKLTVETNED